MKSPLYGLSKAKIYLSECDTGVLQRFSLVIGKFHKVFYFFGARRPEKRGVRKKMMLRASYISGLFNGQCMCSVDKIPPEDYCFLCRLKKTL